MNNVLEIKSPAQDQADALRSDFGLANHGLTNLHQVYWNVPSEALYEEIVFRGEARVTRQGPLVCNTGKHTRPMAVDKFNDLVHRLQGFLQGRDLFVQDCHAGADPEFRIPIRIVTEL